MPTVDLMGEMERDDSICQAYVSTAVKHTLPRFHSNMKRVDHDTLENARFSTTEIG